MTPISELLEHLRTLGLSTVTERTGSPRWVRIFIRKGNLQLGRISVYRGESTGVRWYKGCGSSYPIKLRVLIDYGFLIADEELSPIYEEAELRANEKLQAKLDWRRENPHPAGKRRRRLARPNPASFVWDLITELGETRNSMKDTQ